MALERKTNHIMVSSVEAELLNRCVEQNGIYVTQYVRCCLYGLGVPLRVPHPLAVDLGVKLALSLTSDDYRQLALLAGKPLVGGKAGDVGEALRCVMFHHQSASTSPLPSAARAGPRPKSNQNSVQPIASPLGGASSER